MFLSNLYHLKRNVFLVGLFALLSACSSLPTDEQELDPKTQVDSQKGKGQTATNQNPQEASGKQGVPQEKAEFVGPDPMGDIQINAEIKKVYAKVANLNKFKKYSEAIKLLTDTQLKYPQLSGPDYQKARIYFNQAKFDEALLSVESSIKNNPRNYYSINLKGIILREKGDFEGAKTAYYKAIEVYPPYPNSHLNLGVLADIYLQELPLALIQYQSYMKLTNNSDKTVANWIVELERRIKSGG